jgi:hypothetical protein
MKSRRTFSLWLARLSIMRVWRSRKKNGRGGPRGKSGKESEFTVTPRLRKKNFKIQTEINGN